MPLKIHLGDDIDDLETPLPNDATEDQVISYLYSPKIRAQLDAAGYNLAPLPQKIQEDQGFFGAFSSQFAPIRSIKETGLGAAELLGIGSNEWRARQNSTLEVERRLSAISPEYVKFGKQEGWWDAITFALTNPSVLGAIAGQGASSIAPMILGGGVPGLGAKALFSLAPSLARYSTAAAKTFGLVGAELAELSAEYGGRINEFLEDKDIDIADDQAVAAALKDPSVISEIKEQALLEAGIITAFGGLGIGLAGIFKPLAKGVGLGTRIGRFAGEVGLQTALEAGGEATAQYVGRGEVNPPDVVAEGLGAGIMQGLTTPKLKEILVGAKLKPDFDNSPFADKVFSISGNPGLFRVVGGGSNNENLVVEEVPSGTPDPNQPTKKFEISPDKLKEIPIDKSLLELSLQVAHSEQNLLSRFSDSSSPEEISEAVTNWQNARDAYRLHANKTPTGPELLAPEGATDEELDAVLRSRGAPPTKDIPSPAGFPPGPENLSPEGPSDTEIEAIFRNRDDLLRWVRDNEAASRAADPQLPLAIADVVGGPGPGSADQNIIKEQAVAQAVVDLRAGKITKADAAAKITKALRPAPKEKVTTKKPPTPIAPPSPPSVLPTKETTKETVVAPSAATRPAFINKEGLVNRGFIGRLNPEIRKKIAKIIKNKNKLNPQETAAVQDILRASPETLYPTSPSVQPKAPAVYGSKNKLVTKEEAEQIAAELRDISKNQLSAGIDPRVFALGAKLVIYHLEAGLRSFSSVVLALSNSLGSDVVDKFRSYLRGWYNGAVDIMRDSGIEVTGTSSPAEIDAFFAKENRAKEDRAIEANKKKTTRDRSTKAKAKNLLAKAGGDVETATQDAINEDRQTAPEVIKEIKKEAEAKDTVKVAQQTGHRNEDYKIDPSTRRARETIAEVYDESISKINDGLNKIVEKTLDDAVKSQAYKDAKKKGGEALEVFSAQIIKIASMSREQVEDEIFNNLLKEKAAGDTAFYDVLKKEYDLFNSISKLAFGKAEEAIKWGKSRSLGENVSPKLFGFNTPEVLGYELGAKPDRYSWARRLLDLEFEDPMIKRFMITALYKLEQESLVNPFDIFQSTGSKSSIWDELSSSDFNQQLSEGMSLIETDFVKTWATLQVEKEDALSKFVERRITGPALRKAKEGFIVFDPPAAAVLQIFKDFMPKELPKGSKEYYQKIIKDLNKSKLSARTKLETLQLLAPEIPKDMSFEDARRAIDLEKAGIIKTAGNELIYPSISSFFTKFPDAATEVIDFINTILPDFGSNVDFVQHIQTIYNKEGEVEGIVTGRFLKDQLKIQLVPAIHSNMTDLIGEAAHEMIHALRALDIINSEDWNLLEQWAKKQLSKFDYKDLYSKLSPDKLLEEVVADGFRSNVMHNTNAPQSIQNIFEKIMAFLERIFNKVSTTLFGKDAYITPEYQVREFFRNVHYGKAYGNISVKEKIILTNAAKYAYMGPNGKKFATWFGDSVVRDAEGPKVLYHATMAREGWLDVNSPVIFTKTRDLGYHFGTPAAANERIRSWDLATNTRGFVEDSVVFPSFIRMENPLILPDMGGWKPIDLLNKIYANGINPDLMTKEEYTQLRYNLTSITARDVNYYLIVKHLKKKGIDGIVYPNKSEGSNDVDNLSYMVFDPEQIKSVYNDGRFDFQSPDAMNSIVPVEKKDAPIYKPMKRQNLEGAERPTVEVSRMGTFANSPRHIASNNPVFAPIYAVMQNITSYAKAIANEVSLRLNPLGRELGKNMESFVRMNKAFAITQFMNFKKYRPNERGEIVFTFQASNLKEEAKNSFASSNNLVHSKYFSLKDGDTVILKGKEADAYLKSVSSMEFLHNELSKAFLIRNKTFLNSFSEYGILPMEDAEIENVTVDKLINIGKKIAAYEARVGSDKMPPGYQSQVQQFDKLIKALIAKEKQAEGDYFPLMRFGNYYIPVRNKEGKVVHFEFMEYPMRYVVPGDKKRKDAARIAELKILYPGHIIDIESRPLTKKQLEIDAADAFGDLDLVMSMLSHDKEELYNDLRNEFDQSIFANEFEKFFKRRNYMSGFDGDFGRSLVQYASGVSGYVSRIRHTPLLNQHLNNVAVDPNIGHNLKKSIEDYVDYSFSPKQEHDTLRNIAFFYYLGGNVSSALLQVASIPTIALPHLNMYASLPNLLSTASRTLKDSLGMYIADSKTFADAALSPNGFNGTAKEKDYLLRAFEEGIVKATSVIEESALSPDRQSVGVPAKMTWLKRHFLTNMLALPFSNMETISRTLVFMTAIRLAESNPKVLENAKKVNFNNALWQAETGGNPTVYQFAKFVTEDAFAVFGKGNRAKMMRGVGTIAFQFQGYVLQMLELMGRMVIGRYGNKGRMAVANMAIMAVLLGGLRGLPGADDLLDTIDFFSRQFGIDYMINAEIRKGLHEISGRNAVTTEILENGYFNSIGLNVQKRISLGNLPGSELVRALVGGETPGMFGAVGSMIAEVPRNSAKYLAAGRPEEALINMLPTAIKNVLKANIVYPDKGLMSSNGTKLLTPEEITTQHRIFKSVGFEPTIFKDVREMEYYKHRVDNAVDGYKMQAERRIEDLIVEAIRDARAGKSHAEVRSSFSEVKKIMQQVYLHNSKAEPHLLVVINNDNILKRVAERLVPSNIDVVGKPRKLAVSEIEKIRGTYSTLPQNR